jgi:hypothetical protein
MRPMRDSFLHFLADNLSGVPVHNRRKDPNDPSAYDLREGAVNVEFMSFEGDPHVSVRRVVIDVIHADELTAESWVSSVWNLLKAAFYTTIKDYTNPAAPVTVPGHMMWDRNSVRFRRVFSEHYTHYSCVLPVKFHA